MVRLDQREGVELDLGDWRVSDEFLGNYLGAVGDGLSTYFQHRLAPPVALAARALGALLQRLELPPGAIHSLQEIETREPVAFGEQVIGTAFIGSAKRRGGMEFINVGLTLKNREGRPTLRGKSTVLVVDRSSGPPGKGGPARGENRPQPSTETRRGADDNAQVTALPAVTKTITQKQLSAYAEVSGDRNPLHLDAEFAAATMFGGIIAHGMLTLAFISEMMAVAFDKTWLETGGLRVRFKSAAYLGDRVETRGRVAKEEPTPNGRLLSCNVSAHNQTHGQELISGTATVVLDRV